MTKKSKIPKPPKKKDVSMNRTEEFRRQWFELLDTIDQKLLIVIPQGDPDCPKNFYDTDIPSEVYGVELPYYDSAIHFFIVSRKSVQSSFLKQFGNGIFFCDHNHSFGTTTRWILADKDIQDNPWTNHELISSWEEMYNMLVLWAEEEHRRIPQPPQ